MSEFAEVVTAPEQERIQYTSIRTVLMIGAIMLAIVAAVVLAAMRSEAVRLTREQIRQNERVRHEFGENVRVPAGIGYAFRGRYQAWAYVRGERAEGWAVAAGFRDGNAWKTTRLEVHDNTEDHLINLSPAPAAASAEQLTGQGRLYMVAMGASAANEVADAAAFLKDSFGIAVKVLPPMELAPEAEDSARKQWVAEVLAESLAQKFPEVAGDPEGKIIGITDSDVYIRSFGWKYTHNYRYADKYAVIPTARLDPGFYGLLPSAEIRRERLRKMVMKSVGILYLGFDKTDNPASVMLFGSEPRDLDLMSGQYLVADIETRSRGNNPEGEPCLTFSGVNLAGVPRLNPIDDCFEPYDLSQSSFFKVDLSRGTFLAERNDLYSIGPMPLSLRRLQFSQSYEDKVHAFGRGTWQSLDDYVMSPDPQRIQTISLSGVQFARMTRGTGFSPDARYRAPDNAGEFSGAMLSWNRGWYVENPEGTVWHYLDCTPESEVLCYFMDKTNVAGDLIEVERDARGRITRAFQKKKVGVGCA